MMRTQPFPMTFFFLLSLIFFTIKAEGGYYHRPNSYHNGHSQWPSYYAYYGGPAYAAYPYTSAYAYYYPSSYYNYTYPSYPYFGYYYRNNTIIRSPANRTRNEVRPANGVYIYQTNKEQSNGKQESGVFFYSD